MIRIKSFLKRTLSLCLAGALIVGAIVTVPEIKQVEAAGSSTEITINTGEGVVFGEDVIAKARQYINKTPYVYSGTSLTGGADCSGFCIAIYQLFGIDFMRYRSTYDMMTNASKIGVNLGTNTNVIMPGDLVFTYGGEHVGIATSKTTYVHMSSSRGCCVEDLFYSEVCMIIRPYNVYSKDNYIDPDKNIYMGVDYSPVYNYMYFVANNSKIASSLGDPAKSKKAHKIACLTYFINNGMDQALRATGKFDVYSYYNQYRDLRRAYGKDYKKYYLHYIEIGKAEGRICTGVKELQDAETVYGGVDYKDIYDYNYYLSKNSDVKKSYAGDENKVLEHFVKYGMKEGRASISTFDLRSYRFANADLRTAYKNDNEKYYRHYMNYGLAEGRTATGVTEIKNPVTKPNGVNYSPVYNYKEYINAYPDVAAKYPDDDIAVLEYFVSTGMAAGEKGNSKFDVYSYKNAYADLRKSFGNDLKKYYMHYLNYGKAEGRKEISGVTKVKNPITVYGGVNYKSIYNFNYYMSKNPDLKKVFGNDDIGALEHFVKYGMKEGRASISTFDLKSYKFANADLRKAFRNDNEKYYRHYMTNGKAEGRTATGVTEIKNPVTTLNGVNYKAVYNYKFYISTYTDIAAHFDYDDIAILEYFVNTGMAEGQRGNDTFDVYSYRNAYADLRRNFGTDLTKYYMHYVNYGQAEGRAYINGVTELRNPTTIYNGVDYKLIYDYNVYLNSNSDLKKAFNGDENAAIAHFVNYGMAEGRKSSNKFDLGVYKSSNGDLQKAFGDDNAAYYLHYLNYGAAEGRKAY